MKILLADDDKNIRFVLKSMLFDVLDDTETSIEEARSGQELVDLCMENPPDLAFVDIQMPEMDGISAIKAAKPFVILTGFSEFEYARKCIPLGILDYLLKPIETEELKKVIGKARDKIAASRNREQSLFQTRVYAFARYYPDMGNCIAIPDEKLPRGMIYVVCNFIFLFPPEFRARFSVFRHEFVSKLNTYAASSFSPHSIFSVYFTTSGLIRCIVRTDSDDICQKMTSHAAAFSFFPSGVPVSLKVIWQTAETIREALKKSDDFEFFHYRTIGLSNFSVTAANDITSDYDIFFKDLWILHNMLDENTEIQYGKAVKKFSEEYCVLPKGIPLSGMLDYFKYAFDETQGLCLNSWNDCLHILVSVGFHKEDEFLELADRVKKYIDRNYMNNIGINQIADQFSVTPNYLSSLFHRKTGIKLLDYMTSLRIEKAKQLLRKNLNVSVKDIALMTGYTNPRYFSTLFRNATGVLPTQFRNGCK